MALYQVKAYCQEINDSQEFMVEDSTELRAIESARRSLAWLENEENAEYSIEITELERNQSWCVVFENYDIGEEKRLYVVGANEVDSVTLAKKELRVLLGDCYFDWEYVEAFRSRGGRRAGAGRPPENKPKKTVVKRIPVEMAERLDKIDSLLQLIEDWKDRSGNSPETSPRWERCREMLSEISELLGE